MFAVPRSLIKPFNSDTVRIISNFAKLPRGQQNLLLGKTEADTRGDVFPDEAKIFSNAESCFPRLRPVCMPLSARRAHTSKRRLTYEIFSESSLWNLNVCSIV